MLQASRKRWAWLVPCVQLAVAVASASAHLAHAQSDLQATSWALRGIDRIQLPLSQAPELHLASSASYGYTESLGAERGAHHRIAGTLAVGVAPVSWFGAALRFDGRHDLHPDDGMGTDSSSIGDPRLLVHAGTALGERFQVGAALALWVPGQDAPSLKLDASTLDASVTCAYLSPDAAHAWTLAAQLGYRLDDSSVAAPARSSLRAGDRLTLAASDFDALLMTLGAVHRRGALELLTELSWDRLLGRGAPQALQSPLRWLLGTRYALSDRFSMALSATVSPSARPTQTVRDAFVPIEPRFTLEAGLRFAFGAGHTAVIVSPAPVVAAPVPQAAPVAPPPAPATIPQLEGRLLDPDGAAIADARVLQVTADPKATPVQAQTDADGRYTLHDVPLGPLQLRAEHDGYEPQEWTLEVELGSARLEDHALSRVPMGQLRGLALSFRGKPVAAQLTLQSLTRADAVPSTLSAGEDGTFRVDLTPDRYRVEVSAAGFTTQAHEIEIEDGAVLILNVDLRNADTARKAHGHTQAKTDAEPAP